MRQPRETEQEHPPETRRRVEGLSCPCCGARRLQFGGDRENPWRCLACGAGFLVPDGLLGEESETGPVKSSWEATRFPGQARSSISDAGGRRTVSPGERRVPLPVLIALGWPLRVATLLVGLFVILLGAHGLYVYLNAVDGVLRTDRDSSDLFLAVDVPSQLVGIVNWCSVQALSSWVVPVSLIFGGGLVLWLRENWSPPSGKSPS